MSDTWSDIQEFKSRQSSLREKMKRRKQQLGGLVAGLTDSINTAGPSVSDNKESIAGFKTENAQSKPSIDHTSHVTVQHKKCSAASPDVKNSINQNDHPTVKLEQRVINKVEHELQVVLSDVTLNFPIEATTLLTTVTKTVNEPGLAIPVSIFDNLLHKFAAQQLVSLSSKDDPIEGQSSLVITSADNSKLCALGGGDEQKTASRKRKKDGEEIADSAKRQEKEEDKPNTDSVESLLATHTAKEREEKKVNEEIMQLLSKPSAKEQSLVEKFRSQGGASVREFCQFGTTNECMRSRSAQTPCHKLHFKKIINPHTDEFLGDCSFLNTCFHMETCKYVHYEINYHDGKQGNKALPVVSNATQKDGSTTLFPSQWVSCDLRKFDMSVLGKFAVIMADPPWDIHMELPYGTMGDDEMRGLNVPILQDDGYIFLWVTGRAMELGRECLTLWGYERVDELIWVKTNQLQRIIRTGRTGHWLNHGKEHCLVGIKGNPPNVNRGLDCDVIVAEVRATSHKPDEIYGIIERLCPGSRKIELFGRPHNVQPNWVTLGNQLDGVRLLDPDVVRAFKKRYPDGAKIS